MIEDINTLLVQHIGPTIQEFSETTLTNFVQSRFPILYAEYGRNEKEIAELEKIQEQSKAIPSFADTTMSMHTEIVESPYIGVITGGSAPRAVGYHNPALNPDGSTYISENPMRQGTLIPELARGGYDFVNEVTTMANDLFRDRVNEEIYESKEFIADAVKNDIIASTKGGT